MPDTVESGTVQGTAQANSSIASSWRDFTQNLWLLFPILWRTVKAFCVFLSVLLRALFVLLSRMVNWVISKVSNRSGKGTVNVETNQDQKV